MGIHSIHKLNCRDVLRNPSYLSLVAITLLVPLNSIIQIAHNNTGSAGYVAVYIVLILNLAVFFFLNMLTVSLIVIAEKTSGRCEYYLANKLELARLTRTFSTSAYLLCMGPVLVFNLLAIGYAICANQKVLLELYLSIPFLWFAAAFIIFTYAATNMLTELSMLSKSPERIRTYLSVSAVVFTFTATLPGAFSRKLGFTPGGSSIVWIIGATLLVLAWVCALLRYSWKSKLTNEVVVLSYKQ
ncbi:hypothetical protein [Paenibacillus tepidiphilus]|uniref:hypothetical protein n=1 Tax=Paenibacillus tepidiphilus TaxID=2608683 RepID=UPI001238FD3A|nr:hypothetical protein [Paenibacillus tepidiphilus]